MRILEIAQMRYLERFNLGNRWSFVEQHGFFLRFRAITPSLRVFKTLFPPSTEWRILIYELFGQWSKETLEFVYELGHRFITQCIRFEKHFPLRPTTYFMVWQKNNAFSPWVLKITFVWGPKESGNHERINNWTSQQMYTTSAINFLLSKSCRKYFLTVQLYEQNLWSLLRGWGVQTKLANDLG